MPPPLGIIITVTVLVAAGLAAYENPHVRAWVDRTRHKIAMGLHSLGDEVGPRPRPPRKTSTDVSMHEEKGEMADERRRQAIAEIMERGRVMEERRKRRKLSEQQGDQPTSPTFDAMVDGDGILLQDKQNSDAAAHSSGVEAEGQSSTVRQRAGASDPQEVPSTLHQSVDAPLSLRQLDNDPANAWESRYEQEMREAWDLPLSNRSIGMPSSHASESLINLTPSTEGAPDPEVSIPSAEYLHRPLERAEYFSIADSNSTHTLSEHGSQTSLLDASTHLNIPRNGAPLPQGSDRGPASLTPSMAGSMSDIHASEADESSDDLLSEIDDGVRTPGSTWTDVDSTVSGDFH